MKRSEIESKAREQVLRLKALIDAEPLRAVVVALVGGILLAAFARFFVSLFFLVAVAAIVFWMLAEKDGPPTPPQS